MKAPIVIELRDFLAKTPFSQSDLARMSGVKPAYISRLKTGVQKDILSAYADALRDAMRRLTATPTTPPSEPGSSEGGGDE